MYVEIFDLEIESILRLLPALHAEDLRTTHGAETRNRFTNRRITRDVYGDAGGLADGGAELVAVDAVGVGGLAVPAAAAGEHELVVLRVFLGVKEVGAVEVGRLAYTDIHAVGWLGYTYS